MNIKWKFKLFTLIPILHIIYLKLYHKSQHTEKSLHTAIILRDMMHHERLISYSL